MTLESTPWGVAWQCHVALRSVYEANIEEHRNLIPTAEKMPSAERHKARVEQLVAGFPQYLRAFTDSPPFRRSGQLEFHLETIRLRRQLGSVKGALKCEPFLVSLYRTLQAWGIGVRASRIVAFERFAAALRASADELSAFDDLTIDSSEMQAVDASKRLWRVIDRLEIVENKAKLVASTKALHHLLPDLVVPVDRAYTQRFFGWHNPEFQNGQAAFFTLSFKAFVEIARRTGPGQYVGADWCSSRTKVIDNAIVGMLLDGVAIDEPVQREEVVVAPAMDRIQSQPGRGTSAIGAALQRSGAAPRPADIEKVRTALVQRCLALWKRTQSDEPSHSISVVINQLQARGALSRWHASLMLTLCTLRNLHVYEGMPLGEHENAIVTHALSALQEM